MCLAVPGKIISIDEGGSGLRMAKVDFAGVVREICIEWLPEAGLNDYILAHAGTALNVIDEDEAMLTLQTIREWLDTEDPELKPKDL